MNEGQLRKREEDFEFEIEQKDLSRNANNFYQYQYDCPSENKISYTVNVPLSRALCALIKIGKKFT